MTLRDYVRMLRASWLVVILCLVLGLGCAGLVTMLRPRAYDAHVMLYVSALEPPGDSSDAVQGAELAAQRVKSYEQLAMSLKVADDVVQRLRLSETSEELRRRVDASAETDTVVLDLTFTDETPDRAAFLANAVAESLVRLIDQLERPQDAASGPLVAARLVRAASPPATAQSLNLPTNLALGALLGLLIGVGAAVVRQALDNSVRSPDQLRRTAGVPTLGVVTRAGAKSGARLTVQNDPGSPQAEEFRQLRAALRFNNLYRRKKLFVVSSPGRAEGRTTTACNLAIAFAEVGSRVLLLEADLRNPRAASYLGVQGEKGLTNVLAGDIPLHDAIQSWGDHPFDFLPSGPVPVDPSEMLGSPTMAALLVEARQHYDVVLLDTPPLLPYPDASAVALAPYTDGVLLVVRYGRTGRHHVEAVARRLGAVSAHLLGTVLTMVPRHAPDRFADLGVDVTMLGRTLVPEQPTMKQQPSAEPRANLDSPGAREEMQQPSPRNNTAVTPNGSGATQLRNAR